MADLEERLDGVERQLGKVEGQLVELTGRVDHLRGEVGDLRGEVGDLRGEVGDLRGGVGNLRGEVGDLSGEVGSLRSEVQKGRVLEEANAAQIKLIAEVQTHHGELLTRRGDTLQRLEAAVEPLKVLPDLIKQVVQDHETRIAALERARQ
jgi:chromosome segregation ATPase